MRRIFKQEYLQGCTSVLGVQNQHLDDGMQYLDSGIQLESGSEFVSGYMKSRYADIRAILNTKKQHNIEQSVTLGKRYADLTNTDGSSSGKLEGQLEIVENLLSQLERLCASMGNSVSNIQSENPNGAILLDNLSSSRVADMQAGNMYEWFDENGNYNIKVIGLWMLMDDSRLTEQQIQIRDQYIRDVIANKDHSTIVDLMRDYIYIDCDKFSKSQQDFYAAVEANCDELIADYWTNEANFGENWWTNERKRENALGYLTLESVMKDGLDVDALRFSSNTKAINPKEQAYQLLLLDVPSEEIDWSQLYNKTENLMSTYGVDFQDCGNIIPPEQVMYFYLEHEALEAWADENARAVISMALDMCPGVGDVKNGIEFFAQKDLITGQKLTAFDYAMMIVPTAILRHTPSGIRKIVGRLPGGKYADDIAETAESVAKHVDEVAEVAGKVEVGKSGKTTTYKILNTSSAEDVNKIFKDTMGYEPPYKPGTSVTEIQLTENATYVRVYDKVNSRMQGGWVMKAEDIAGLTPQEIQNKFALPNTPKYICDVNLEAGTRLRTGEVNPLFGFDGGGQQYDLIINGKNVGTFTNERIIGQ